LQHSVAVLVVEFDGQHTPAMSQALAQRLVARVREYDLLGQWDEGRFLLVLPDADVGAALVLAQDLCDGQNRHPPQPGTEPRQASVSVGVHARQPALRDATDELALSMVAAAQRALDATRSDGPGRVEVEL
jgi:GGDEF domain-containing protein